MTQMRTAWRRAVDAFVPDRDSDVPTLADLLAFIGPEASASSWTCEDVECSGPGAADLRQEADAGPIEGKRLRELAAGISRIRSGVFAAARLGEDWPWLALRAADGNHFVVATRNRTLLDRLRRRFVDGVGRED